MTDLVYITGGKSMWQYNELRYSLRSMAKHLSNIGNVFVVGKCPEWLTGVMVIESEDITWMLKEPRLYRKWLIACRDERISQDMIVAYDDEYLLAEHDTEVYPSYFQGTVGEYPDKIFREGTHKECARNSVVAFGAGAGMFDVHCPVRVNRHQFLTCMTSLDWNNVRDGWLIKTAYSNLTAASGTPVLDTKINHPDGTLEEYRSMIEGRKYFSTGDHCNFEALGRLMEELYPVKSQWEK